MIRLFGTIAILTSFFLIGVTVGYELALYWASPAQMVEAVKLRVEYYLTEQPERFFQ